VRLTPSERDRLLIFAAAELARQRLARGLRLNVPEATALLADTVCEAAREGRRLSEAVAAGQAVLGPDQVLPGVREIVGDVKVEAVFEDGTRLAVVTMRSARITPTSPRTTRSPGPSTWDQNHPPPGRTR